MLIYSKIDGFHKFGKYTLCPPKSNPDYGSACTVTRTQGSPIICMYSYHKQDLKDISYNVCKGTITRSQGSLIHCMYRYHLQDLRDLSYIVCIGTTNKTSRISHTLYV